MEFKKALKAVVCDIDVPYRAYETSITCPACKLRITCRACKLRITCAACNLRIACRACKLGITCRACKLRITCRACNLRIACRVCKLGIACRACKLRITCRACKLRITCPASNFFKTPLNHTQSSLGPLRAYGSRAKIQARHVNYASMLYDIFYAVNLARQRCDVFFKTVSMTKNAKCPVSIYSLF